MPKSNNLLKNLILLLLFHTTFTLWTLKVCQIGRLCPGMAES